MSGWPFGELSLFLGEEGEGGVEEAEREDIMWVFRAVNEGGMAGRRGAGWGGSIVLQKLV